MKTKKNKYKNKVRSINVNQLFYLIISTITFQKVRSFETVNRFSAQRCHPLHDCGNR